MENILIVAFDSQTRNLAHGVLRTAYTNAVIVHAHHGTALKIIEAHRVHGRKFNLVIIDVQMPQVDGVQLVEAITKNHPDIFVILMSSTSEPKDHKAHALVQKPIGTGRLLATINRLMEKP